MSVFLRWHRWWRTVLRRAWGYIVEIFHGRPAYEVEPERRITCPFIEFVMAPPWVHRLHSSPQELAVEFALRPKELPQVIRGKRHPGTVPIERVPEWLRGLKWCPACQRLSWFPFCPWDNTPTVSVTFYDALEEV